MTAEGDLRREEPTANLVSPSSECVGGGQVYCGTTRRGNGLKQSPRQVLRRFQGVSCEPPKVATQSWE